LILDTCLIDSARDSPNVREMTRLDRAFGLYETDDIAIAELRERRTRPKTKSPQHEAAPPSHGPQRRRGFAPLLTALLRAHQRQHAGEQPSQTDRHLPGVQR